MNIKYLFCLLITLYSMSLGYAQCSDSVRVYVYPEVICPGEVVHLSTDSTRLLCVNIGDIICVHNDSHDTVIVSPSDWTLLGLENSYSPLSVVFYVDETCQHGWAVKDTTSYKDTKWSTSMSDISSITNCPNITSAIEDIDGKSNTSAMLAANADATQTLSPPFYIPAIGQLNCLYSQAPFISSCITSSNNPHFLLNYGKWWSSTELNDTKVWFFDISIGEISNQKKNLNPNSKKNYVIPIMNF